VSGKYRSCPKSSPRFIMWLVTAAADQSFFVNDFAKRFGHRWSLIYMN
jgi:hypothetical protein